ncbi:phosphoribosylglycinamide formyltransferase [Candidatus Parcubacteria bacterium]|nr:phosphoribosylglycinamide formyltransferase [Candidatus Parcubacteria bacterium]
MSKQPPRLAILVSGTGTILEAILASGLPVSLVLADRDCRGLKIAQAAGVPTAAVQRREFGYAPGADWDRERFTQNVVDQLRQHGTSIVAMSGFMTVFTQGMFDAFPGRVLNTHPSLLPAFKGGGQQAVAGALAAKVPQTGCTVHLATLDLDAGPILAQVTVPVRPDDTVETLWERIKAAERQLYPATIRTFMTAVSSQGS